MTADQALQLLFLHEKSVRQSWEQPHRRKRRNESEETYTERLRAMWTAEQARQAEDEAIRKAMRENQIRPGTGRGSEHVRQPGGLPTAQPDAEHRQARSAVEGPALPSLDQVTGWSKASGKPPHNPNLALFGGWRLTDWKKGQGGR